MHASPTAFAIPTCSYTSLANEAFPAFSDGIYLAAILDHCGFAPLMDMRYGLVWRLHCKKVLTGLTCPGLLHFRTFLQCGADGITPDTYLHANIPGHLCPNFGFHFQPHNKVWPDLADPIEHFKSDKLVGLEAQDHKPVTIKVHSDRWAPIPALLTRDEHSTTHHRAATPQHTRASLCCSPHSASRRATPPCPPLTVDQPGNPFCGLSDSQ